MELLTGEPLAARIKREGRLSWSDTGTILEQAASALDAMHAQNIVHRDLSPRNIFLCTAAQAAFSVKVIDFGIAKLLNAPGNTGPGQVMGTPCYMSPEQASGSSATSDRPPTSSRSASSPTR